MAYIPILTKIEDSIKEAISEMTVGDGYYFDWGSVNDPDTRKQDYPSAEIFISSEDNQDESNGVWAGGYNQHVEMIIRVRCKLDQEEDQPSYEINKKLNMALDDIKRLFGINYTVSDSCETIMYRGMTRIPDKSNDILRPAYMDTRWLIMYTQDRQRPDLFSN